MSEALPTYEALGSHDPPWASWSVWPDSRQWGTLNHLTPDRVRAAALEVRSGRVFSLALGPHAFDPPLFGRSPTRHRLTNPQADSLHHDDVLDDYNTQVSSQWDGFRHVRHPVHGWYGGLPEARHGVHHWAQRGIVGRGTLVDVAAWRTSEGRPLNAQGPEVLDVDDLEATLAWQGTHLEAGDILCIRTGWLAWYKGASTDDRAAVASTTTCVGLKPGHRMAAWLWDSRVAAVACDNPTVEAWPIGSPFSDEERTRLEANPMLAGELSMHRSIVPLLGIPLGELFDFDALASDCADDHRWHFLLTAAPLPLVGGAASPANALALR